MFSTDEWNYLQILYRYGDPVPLAWMAEQLGRNPEWLSLYVEPSLVEFGLVGITAMGRVALARVPLNESARRALAVLPDASTCALPDESAMWVDAAGRDPWSTTTGAQEGDPHDPVPMSVGEDPAGKPCASGGPFVPGESRGRSRKYFSTQLSMQLSMQLSSRSGSLSCSGRSVWGTPDSGRAGWTVVEQNWGLARPG